MLLACLCRQPEVSRFQLRRAGQTSLVLDTAKKAITPGMTDTDHAHSNCSDTYSELEGSLLTEFEPMNATLLVTINCALT